jgi:hypothetical protein
VVEADKLIRLEQEARQLEKAQMEIPPKLRENPDNHGQGAASLAGGLHGNVRVSRQRQ